MSMIAIIAPSSREIYRNRLAANTLAPGTPIIANVPLPPAVYRELRSQAASVNKTPAQLMAAILSARPGIRTQLGSSCSSSVII